MRKLYSLSFFFIFLNSPGTGFSQKDTSVLFFGNNFFSLKDSIFLQSFYGIRREPFKHNFIYLAGIGSNGFSNESNYQDYSDFYSDQLGRQEERKLFGSVSPYVGVKYFPASNKEQFFNVVHCQSFGTRFGYSVNYSRTRTEGFYLHQLSVSDVMDAGVFFRSKNNTYRVQTIFSLDNKKREENGGIANDSLFESGEFSNNKLHEINLPEAKNSIKNKNIFLQQDFHVFGTEPDGFFISSETELGEKSKIYFDNPSSGYYSSIYHDSIATRDSLALQYLNNKLKFVYTFNEQDYFSFFGKYSVSKYHDPGFDSLVSNLSVGMHSRFMLLKRVKNEISIISYISGYNKSDYLFSDRSEILSKNNTHEFHIRVSAFSQKPSISQLSYHSNHFTWERDFKSIKTHHLAIGYKHKKLLLSVEPEINVTGNLVYYNHFSLPEQINDLIFISKIKLKKSFLLKKWRLDNEMIYQNTSMPDVVRIPSFITQHSFYFTSKAWSMNYCFGADIYYYPSFYSNAYSPALGLFYLQNEKKTGNYPYLGVFFEGKIKTVTFFLSINHINEGIFDRTYYSTLHYPMNDRTLRFGIKWDFYH